MSKTAPHNSAPERLRALQHAFAGHIRDPERVEAPPGIEERRMKIYRELFFENINKFISRSYPVLRRLYADDDWDRLIREFFIEHRCQTPLFPELPREFLRYLTETRQAREDDPPFLLELAHYEWIELALKLDERSIEDVEADSEGDLLEGAPVFSPLAWPLSYRFPVHRIRPDFQPEEAPPEATHLLVYRRRDDTVRFMRLNAVSRLLIAEMQERAASTGREMLEAVAAAIGHRDPPSVVAAGAQLLADWRNKDIVLGTRPPSR